MNEGNSAGKQSVLWKITMGEEGARNGQAERTPPTADPKLSRIKILNDANDSHSPPTVSSTTT